MEVSSFFNSVSGDRKYKAEDWAEYFASFVGNGVFPVPSAGLQVVASTAMTVKVQTGKAWINGYFYYNKGDLLLTLATADGVLQRIDRIVIRWDLTERTIKTVVKSSTPSASPVAPTLQRDADAYEIAIADVLIGAGVTAITQAAITDRRYTSALCGIVAGVVQQFDISSYTAQFDDFFRIYKLRIIQEFEAYVIAISEKEGAADNAYNSFVDWLEAKKALMVNDFETWFQGVKDILGEDAAGNLQNEIEALQTVVAERVPDTTIGTVTHELSALYPCCILLIGSYAFGVGAFGMGAFGGTELATVPADYVYDGHQITVSAPSAYAAYSNVQQVEADAFAFMAEDAENVQSLLLKLNS